jgi:hypothetical protein
MSGVYTNIVKKRIEQSKEADLASTVSEEEQKPQTLSQPHTDLLKNGNYRSKINPPHFPTPLSNNKNIKKNAKDGKHQVSGWIPMESFEEFILLHRRVNPAIEKVEKQYMLGLAIDTLGKVIGKDIPVCNSPEKFKAYLESRLKDKF